MKLTEMLGQYEELLDKKDQLAKDTKDNNAAIDKLKAEIAEMMIDEDIPSQGYGDYVYSLQDKVKYSKRGEAYLQERGLDFFEVLRGAGPRRAHQRNRQCRIPAERDERDRRRKRRRAAAGAG